MESIASGGKVSVLWNVYFLGGRFRERD